jgi:hypothetical protein
MMMLRAAGMFLVALGSIWVLQGAGLLDWPADSFMLGRSEWITRGLEAALVGAGLLGLVQYRQRK